jgi:hypothetical protein
MKFIRPDTKAVVDIVRATMKSKTLGAGELFNANLGGGMDKAQEMFGGNYAKVERVKCHEQSFQVVKYISGVGLDLII